jgi:hypothetical protein
MCVEEGGGGSHGVHRAAKIGVRVMCDVEGGGEDASCGNSQKKVVLFVKEGCKGSDERQCNSACNTTDPTHGWYSAEKQSKKKRRRIVVDKAHKHTNTHRKDAHKRNGCHKEAPTP